MIFPEKDFLSLFGWDDVYLTKEQYLLEDFLPARVIGEERNLYRLQLGLEKTKLAVQSGRMRHESFDRLDLPAVCELELQNPAVPICAISSLQETSLQVLQTYL